MIQQRLCNNTLIETLQKVFVSIKSPHELNASPKKPFSLFYYRI